jgi:hypothetical protein
MISGSLASIAAAPASIAAALALAACARREGRRAPQPLNASAIGCMATAQRRAGRPAAAMWAMLFESLRQRSSSDSSAAVVRDAAITSVVAAAVDYTITPHRFTPGGVSAFEAVDGDGLCRDGGGVCCN